MRLRKVMITLLSFFITSSLVIGCGNNKDKEKSEKVNSTVIGKYNEEDVEIPLKQNEIIFRLLKTVQGSMDVYVSGDSGYYVKYTSSNGKEWKEEDASWLSSVSGGWVVSLTAGEDGNNYAIVTDEESKMYLLKQTGEETADIVNLSELNESDDKDSDSYFYTLGTELRVMANGNLVLEGKKEVRVYNQADGKLSYSLSYEKLSTDVKYPIDVNGENIVLPSKDNNGFTIWNGGEEKAHMSYGFDVRYGEVILEENNEIYFLDVQGIHHMRSSGTLVETLAEGNSMTMGLQNTYILDFMEGSNEDFYVLYAMSNNKISLKHYFYNENVEKNLDKKLNIYSLEENDAVRQAVSIFSQEYPDVEISYMTGESDSSATRADKIRVLNTELFNKKGADILLLDDLPMDSLMEKGVLKDISNIINPLIEDETIYRNIAECYRQEDGKIYAMPVKYGIPILYGNQEIIDALDNLDTLENWLDTHENQPIFTKVTYDKLTNLFVNMYYEEIFGEDGELNQDKLGQCLTCVKKVGERVQAEMESPKDMPGEYFSDWMAGSPFGVINENQVASGEMVSIIDMMIPFTVLRENNLPLLLNKDTFVPLGLVGINSASTQTELAEEFVKILFSKETQEYSLRVGFPINQNAEAGLMEQGVNNLEEQEEWSSGTIEIDGKSYFFGMPLKTEIEELLKKAKELRKPAQADCVLLDMIFQEAKLYYGENKEVEQTLQGIIAMVDTYLAE